ncbi:putative addiction module antidote protein [bacterium]|nr:putative addiction module antidote protein [bacterium]
MKSTKFDIAEYLDDPEMIQEYINTVLEEGDSDEIITALGHVAKAIGMTKIAQQTGLSRPSLYKALSKNSKPQFETILKVLRAIGEHLKLKPSL